MRNIIFIILIVFLSIGVFSASVCTVDENGHYTCSFELPDPESVEKEYREGTFEIIIGSKQYTDRFFIDTKKSSVFFNGKSAIIDKDDVEEILELLYSQEKDDDDEKYFIKVFSSDYKKLDLKVSRSKKANVMNKIGKIINKGKNDL